MLRTCLWLAFFAFFTALIAVVGAEDYRSIPRTTEPRNLGSVIVEQQPFAERVNTSFRTQPILWLQEPQEEGDPQSGSTRWAATATLYRPTMGSAEKAPLMGTTSLDFVRKWANFTDLMALHPDAGYVLEFHITSSDNKSLRVSSTPFGVFDHSLAVHVTSVRLAASKDDTFTVSPTLQLWDFVLDKPAEETSLKRDLRYMLSLRFGDCYQGKLKGDTSGVFPDGQNHTEPHNLVITHTGYHYQLKVTVTSPYMQITITNVSVPFDAIREATMYATVQDEVILYFNGSHEEFEADRDLFLATFLNHFGSRYNNVFWRNATFLEGEISVRIILIGESQTLQDTTHALWNDAKHQHAINVSGVSYALQQQMRLEGEAFYGPDNPHLNPDNSILTINGISLATIFTIVLMSFLCASFVIAVFLWRIRERKVLESYNRRVRTRRRQNGHVNNAYENTENGARNNERSEVYLIALNQRSKENACSEMGALRRCSSGGLGTSRDLRNVRRANAKPYRANTQDDDDDPDAELHKALKARPSDDTLGYDDGDKQDETFQEVFFSPPTSRPATIASSTSSFHDDYLLDDLPGPSYAKYIGAKMSKGGTSSANLSTPTESTASSYQTARAVSRILVSPASETCSFPCSSGSSHAIYDKFHGAP